MSTSHVIVNPTVLVYLGKQAVTVGSLVIKPGINTIPLADLASVDASLGHLVKHKDSAFVPTDPTVLAEELAALQAQKDALAQQ